MPMLYKAWPCLLILALAAGCATPSVVNLTPGSLPPSESGFYRIEMAWEGRPGVVKDSVRPVLMVGQEDYPMEAVPLTEGRWETLIPFPEGRREIHYQYKIEYRELEFGREEANSRLSEVYRLSIEP